MQFHSLRKIPKLTEVIKECNLYIPSLPLLLITITIIIVFIVISMIIHLFFHVHFNRILRKNGMSNLVSLMVLINFKHLQVL